VCGSGNGLDLVMQHTGMDYVDACKEIDELIGNNNPDIGKEVVMRDERHKQELDYFHSLDDIKGSPAELYLKNRGIEILPQYSVRFSPKQYSISSKSPMPSMYCIVSNEKNKIKYIHNTFILGGVKANVDHPKQMKTIVPTEESVACKMFPLDSNILGIGEGVETCLSAMQLYGITTWALMNSSFLKRFIAPDKVQTLVIFADNDSNGTGLQAAFTCGRKNILNRNNVNKVVIYWPKTYNTDFNDVLHTKDQVFKWTLKP